MLTIAAVLLVAVLALFAPRWLSAWALRRAVADPAAAWFGYGLRLQWLTVLTMAGVPALIVIAAPGELHGFLGRHFPNLLVHVFGLIAYVLPAAALRWSALHVSHDLSHRLRLVETSREVTRELAWLEAAALLVPFSFIGGAIGAFASFGVGAALAGLVAAFASLVVIGARARKLQGFTLHAVTSGELRDRVFALAARARVRLDQLFVLPLGKWRHANAFATSGQQVLVTDYLLEHLDRDEVDAVLAHEVAHLRAKDPARYSLFFSVILACCIVLPFFSAPFQVVLAIAFGGSFLWLGYSRRREYAADAGAVELGASPRAAITGLAKISRLGFIPLDYPIALEWLLTHPSMTRRAHAIGKRAGLDDGEIARLLAPSAEAAAPAAESAAPAASTVAPAPPPAPARYVAATAAPDAKLFSTHFKQATLARIGLITLCAGLTGGMAVISLARALNVTGWARAATLPLGALFVAAVILVVTDSIGAAGFREIAGAITQRIRERVSHDWMHASLAVGFSPHAAPRVYEGFSAWDVGHVAMLPDRLDYRGEEARFSIAREDIMQVSLAPGLPAWFRTERVLISWKRPDGLAGMFALTPSGVARISAVTRESRALHARIAGWLASPASPSPNLDQPQGRSEWLGPPPSTEVTSNDISDAITLRTMSNLCLLFAVGTLLAGFATRMPNGVSALPGTFDAFLITVLGHLTVIAPMMRIHAREVPEAPREKARAAA